MAVLRDVLILFPISGTSSLFGLAAALSLKAHMMYSVDGD